LELGLGIVVHCNRQLVFKGGDHAVGLVADLGRGAVPGHRVSGEQLVLELGLDEVPKPADAADALAIAICQGYRGSNNSASYTKAQQKWHSAVKSARGKSNR
jgi:hypothetical protein